MEKKQPPSKLTPAEATGPNEPQRKASVDPAASAEIAQWIQQAGDGDLMALRYLYGHASAYLRDKNAGLPDGLSGWLSERLEDIEAVISHQMRGLLKPKLAHAELARALLVQRRGKPGKKKSRTAELDSIEQARDVQHFKESERLSETAAIARATEYRRTKRIRPVGEDQMKSAFNENRAALNGKRPRKGKLPPIP